MADWPAPDQAKAGFGVNLDSLVFSQSFLVHWSVDKDEMIWQLVTIP